MSPRYCPPDRICASIRKAPEASIPREDTIIAHKNPLDSSLPAIPPEREAITGNRMAKNPRKGAGTSRSHSTPSARANTAPCRGPSNMATTAGSTGYRKGVSPSTRIWQKNISWRPHRNSVASA